MAVDEETDRVEKSTSLEMGSGCWKGVAIVTIKIRDAHLLSKYGGCRIGCPAGTMRMRSGAILIQEQIDFSSLRVISKKGYCSGSPLSFMVVAAAATAVRVGRCNWSGAFLLEHSPRVPMTSSALFIDGTVACVSSFCQKHLE